MPSTVLRAEKLGVTLKTGDGSQKATSLDKNVNINLHQSFFPIDMDAGTPISEAFFQKFKKILSDKLKCGDTVILGHHAAGTSIDPMIARVFNELKKEQPSSQLTLHIQGGQSESIYYQEPFDFEGHHRYFQRSGHRHTNHAGIRTSCIADQFPALKQASVDYETFAESSICDREKAPSFLTTKASPSTSTTTKPTTK